MKLSYRRRGSICVGAMVEILVVCSVISICWVGVGTFLSAMSTATGASVLAAANTFIFAGRHFMTFHSPHQDVASCRVAVPPSLAPGLLISGPDAAGLVRCSMATSRHQRLARCYSPVRVQ